ncbi:MAG TPA: hypothetical protein VN442_00335 [Bryobacteraceae bacterium]|nr:hypothetical protein [Bryobacteraceae bacterium]
MKRRGDFFAIDRWTWGQICDRNEMNGAVAYLILAHGTGADNRYTNWSVKAVKTYAGIRWLRGLTAVDSLVRSGFLRRTQSATKEKPCYELVPADELATLQYERNHATLTDYERLLLECVRVGKPPSRSARHSLEQLALRGLLVKSPNGDYSLPDKPSIERDPIWLPGSLVTGAKGPEDAPVRRLRAAGDLWNLRMLIDLYHDHHLGDYGGLNPLVLRQSYERELVGERGIYRVWAFRPGSYSGVFEGPLGPHRHRPKETGRDHPVWDSVHALQAQGLLSFIPHLFEGDPVNSQAELIHPCAGEPTEAELGLAAHRAGLALLPAFKRENCEACWLAPVEKTIPNIQMVGIARLRHRPHTRKTSAWYAELNSTCEHWIEHYSSIESGHPKDGNVLPLSTVRYGS